MNPPKGTINHKIVTSYHGEIRIYFELEKGVEYTKELQTQIKQYKMYLLEQALGYKIMPLDSIIPHDEYEKQNLEIKQ